MAVKASANIEMALRQITRNGIEMKSCGFSLGLVWGIKLF